MLHMVLNRIRNSSLWKLSLCLLLFAPFSLISCNDQMDSHYEQPDWIKGSIYEVLEGRGNYSTFLKGIEIAGYTRIVQGKSILTVMAPNDEAFALYLKENYGVSSIENLPVSEVKKLIGFHLLYYSFDKEQLINFRPEEGDAATAEEELLNAGLYYKFRTKSQDSLTVELDTAGNYVNVYHLERFLPVFSYRMFQTKQIDAEYNYSYFYPNTEWKGDVGFNVSNAAVDEYAVIAKNGYIYTINQVLKPLETIYKELEAAGNYSEFLNLYNRYDYYSLDEMLTLDYGNGTDLYQHYHISPIPSIACEWPATDYTLVSDLAYTSYSAFVPDNAAFTSFFNDYWKVGGYDSLAEVSDESVEYLLFNSVYSKSIAFPEEITKGLIENHFGTIIQFDVDEVPVENRKVCSNGVLYGCDELTPPAMFGSVTGPAYQYKKFSYFLKMLANSDMVLTLCSDAVDYVMLYPSNEQMNNMGITLDSTSNRLQQANSNISNSNQQNYVYTHVVSVDGNATELPTSGVNVIRTLSPNMPLYWFLKDGKITNSIKFTELLKYKTNKTTEEQVFCDFQELTFRDGWTNGKCYTYSDLLFEGSMANAIYGKFIPMMITLRNDETTNFYGFINLLDKAEMLDMEMMSVNVVVENCYMFIPSTRALEEAILENEIPGITASGTIAGATDFFSHCSVTDVEALQYYLKLYFIPYSTAVISNCPYVGWGEDTTPNGLPTLQSYDVVSEDGKAQTITTCVNVFDNGTKLSIQLVGDENNRLIDVIPDYYYLPFIFDDGCVQFIEDVL